MATKTVNKYDAEIEVIGLYFYPVRIVNERNDYEYYRGPDGAPVCFKTRRAARNFLRRMEQDY